VLPRLYPTQTCSIARALEVVGERWTLLVLREATLGATRFDDFRRSLGIATNVLAARLAHLTDEGLLRRVVDGARPEYRLTEKGRAIGPVLFHLLKWGDRYYPAPGGPPTLTRHVGCGGSVGAG
jgi:DNA-binding HxlR family transcriptional regulator